MKSKITDEITRLCLLAIVPVPRVIFTVTGKVAGKFTSWSISKDHELNFNLKLAEENGQEYINRTVIHEIAHYVRWLRNGKVYDTTSGKRRDSHGAKWKAVMLELGATDVTRCHSYDISNVTKRKYKMFEYQCECCGRTYDLTSIRHNKVINKGAQYLCRNHAGASEAGHSTILQFVRAL